MRNPISSTSSTSLSTTRQRYAILAPVLMCCGLGLLIVAQTQLEHRQLTGVGIGALGLGLSLALLALFAAPPVPDRPGALVEQNRSVRWHALGITSILVTLTWLSTGAGVYTAFNVSAWILAVVMWCWAWWPVTPVHHVEAGPSRRGMITTWLVLAAILLVGAFFRLYRLADVPADPTSDHAEKLLDVYDLVSGQRPIFFPRNTGREPGQFYLTYGLMRLFDLPLTFETLKLGTALIGLVTIPAIYLFGREVAGNVAGLIAAALFAIGKWVVNTARMGLRFPYGPLPTAIVLWLLLRYVRRGDRRDALWCGVAIGIGLHGYISFRIVPLLVPLLLGCALVLDRRWRSHWRRLVSDGVLIGGTASLTCLPLLHYSVQHPDQVWYRVATRAASGERALGGWSETLGTFAQNNRNALLAFNWRGDDTLVNAVRHDPFLDLVSGAALLAGLLILGYQVGVYRSPRYALLVLAIPVLLLPSTLNLAFPIENPSVNRLGTVAPVIFLLAALPLAYTAQQLWARVATEASRASSIVRRAAAVGIVCCAWALAAQQNYVRYFHDYDRLYRLHVPNTHEIVRHLRLMQEQGFALDHTYVLAFPYWLDGRNLALALGDLTWQNGHDLPSEVELPTRTDDQPLLFVLHPNDLQRKQQLQARYPDGAYMVVKAAASGKDFAIYTVPGR